MSPFFLVAGFVDGLGEAFVGLALFRVLLVEVRVEHPHQLLPKLLEPRRLVVVELPFPFERSIFLFISAFQFSAFQFLPTGLSPPLHAGSRRQFFRQLPRHRPAGGR